MNKIINLTAGTLVFVNTETVCFIWKQKVTKI